MNAITEAKRAISFDQFEQNGKIMLYAELNYRCKAEIDLHQTRGYRGKQILIDATKRDLKKRLIQEVFGQELIEMRQIINSLLAEVNL